MIKCSNAECGFENPDGSKFCGACGAKLNSKSFCANCGAELIAGAKFCPMCGTPAGVAGQNCTQSVNGFENMQATRQSVENTEVKFDRLKAILDEEQNQELIQAVKDNNIKVVKALMAAGADPNVKNAEGESLLATVVDYNEMRIKYGYAPIATELIKAGASLDIEYEDKKLRWINMTLSEIANNHDYDFCEDEDAYIELLRQLLIQGEDPNIGESEGGFLHIKSINDTPLFWCAQTHFNIEGRNRSNKEAICIELLLKAGADVNSETKDGTIFDLYLQKIGKHSNDYDFFGKKYDEAEMMIDVNNWEKIIALMLDSGADVKIKNANGCTGLHKVNNDRTTALLLQLGVDVNARNNDGNTPLHFVYDETVAKLLIEHGADINARDNDGSTPLYYASDEKVAKLLIEHGADINARNNDGDTPLHCAVSEVAKLLIEHGADVNAKNNDGNTPLHRTFLDDFAEVLIKHGADINAKNNDGKTPLHNACENDNMDIAEMLIEHGADVNAKDNGNKNPCERFMQPLLQYTIKNRYELTNRVESLSLLVKKTDTIDERLRSDLIVHLHELGKENETSEDNRDFVIDCYKLASVLGDASAISKVGHLLEETDEKEAIDWYLKASQSGDIDAMFNLGRLCVKNNDTFAMGVISYLEAAEKGNNNAKEELRDLYGNSGNVEAMFRVYGDKFSVFSITKEDLIRRVNALFE